MENSRASGILLHPTSLPGRYGVGDLGEWAYRFVDFLVETEQSLWQVLPIGPTSYGDSPYQSLSTFAGNPLLISLDRLVEEGWLDESDLHDVPDFPWDRVDYGPVIEYHNQKLAQAYAGFRTKKTVTQRRNFETFCSENAFWLDDFALFVAMKNHHGGRSWVEWPTGEALHEADALMAAMETHTEAVEAMKFNQWVFFSQWLALKAYANERSVRLIGDIPIFVAHDSSDVWANRDLFFLDEAGNPTVVAGVPPDYFSETGQRWGNPIYRWDVMQQQNFNWWIRRIEAALKTVDMLRIDHFRGFDAYWEIPATEETAIIGRWVAAPGFSFFAMLRETLGGDIPIIAEDLGVITPPVRALRDVGWWNSPEEADQQVKHHLGSYINYIVDEPHWALIRLALSSVANTCVFPMQDLLGLGAEARMNTPGQPAGNWTWRLLPEQFDSAPRERLITLTKLYGRQRDASEAVTSH